MLYSYNKCSVLFSFVPKALWLPHCTSTCWRNFLCRFWKNRVLITCYSSKTERSAFVFSVCTRISDFVGRKFAWKWIGRGGPVTWPPSYSDLTPRDVFWGYIKDPIYVLTLPSTLSEQRTLLRSNKQWTDEDLKVSFSADHIRKCIDRGLRLKATWCGEPPGSATWKALLPTEGWW
jgi:hypothetical protein